MSRASGNIMARCSDARGQTICHWHVSKIGLGVQPDRPVSRRPPRRSAAPPAPLLCRGRPRQKGHPSAPCRPSRPAAAATLRVRVAGRSASCAPPGGTQAPSGAEGSPWISRNRQWARGCRCLRSAGQGSPAGRAGRGGVGGRPHAPGTWILPIRGRSSAGVTLCRSIIRWTTGLPSPRCRRCRATVTSASVLVRRRLWRT